MLQVNNCFKYCPGASFRMKSIPFESVHLQFIPIDYEWMRNLFPTDCSTYSFEWKAEWLHPIMINSFSVRKKILIPFESV